MSMVLTSFYGEDKFYGDNTSEMLKLASELIAGNCGKFVANLANYARNEMNLRSVLHALCALLAKSEKGKQCVKDVCDKIILRADDITEVLACYVSQFGKPIPKSLKKGLANAMNKFDEYQFAKYNRKGKDFSFLDVLRLIHAKAKDEKQNAIFQKIINDNLETPYTWETELSQKGNTKEVWEELIESGRLPYFALLRNLNNILKNQVSNIKKVVELLTDEKSILNSKVLPFRYYSAYKTLTNTPHLTSRIVDALEDCLKISLSNVEKLKGKTLIAIDVSGSMSSNISKNSIITCCDIARIMGAMANYICEDSIVTAFSDDLQVLNFSTKNGSIANANNIKFRCAGTEIQLPIEYLIKNKISVDRIIIVSDMESNSALGFRRTKVTEAQRALQEYKKKIKGKVQVHCIDLQGYGTCALNPNNIFFMSGWNENVLESFPMPSKVWEV